MTDTTIKTIPMNGYVGNPDNTEFVPNTINMIEGRYSIFAQSYINACKLSINEDIVVNEEENWRAALKAELENPETFHKDSELSITLKNIVEQGNFASLLQYYNKVNSLGTGDVGHRLSSFKAVKINRISDIHKAFYSKYMHVFHLNHMPGYIVAGQMNLLLNGLSDFAFTKTFKIKQIPIILGGFRQSSNLLKMNVNRALFQNIFSSNKLSSFGVQVLKEGDMKRATHYLTPALKTELDKVVKSLLEHNENALLLFNYLDFSQMVHGMDMMWKYTNSGERSVHFAEVRRRILNLYSPEEVTVDEQSAPVDEAIVAEPQAIEVSREDDIAF